MIRGQISVLNETDHLHIPMCMTNMTKEKKNKTLTQYIEITEQVNFVENDITFFLIHMTMTMTTLSKEIRKKSPVLVFITNSPVYCVIKKNCK